MYEESLEDILEDAVVFDSSLRSEENHESMVAIVAYMDQLGLNRNMIVEWLTEFSKDDTYLIDQEDNYNHMKKHVDNFIRRKGVA